MKMTVGKACNVSADKSELKVFTNKCVIITVSVISWIAVLTGIIVLLIQADNGKHIMSSGLYGKQLMSSFTLSQRTLDRFRRDHKDKNICWDRRPDKDSFFSVIDAHNHFRPFGGPPVEFDTYLQWMQDAGIIFSTMFGIGQLIKKANEDDPECCSYLHCPTLDYKVLPDPLNDRLNALEFQRYKKDENLKSKVHLTLSATFPNLQRPDNITTILAELERDFPGDFQWAGEINVIKHALAGNGFFDKVSSPRITKRIIDSGGLDGFFRAMEEKEWPVTIHCDCGCDNYNAIPTGALNNNPIKGCDVPMKEFKDARIYNSFWRDLLGPFYHAFFYSEHNQVHSNDQNYNMPNFQSFRKVQHLHLMDAILNRYRGMKVVWAHMCLSKELLSLHPRVHSYIMEKFLTKYENLYVDISWDVLAKMVFLSYDEREGAEKFSEIHSDISHQMAEWNATHINVMKVARKKLHEKWDEFKDIVHPSGSYKTLTGPTHSFTVYLDLFEKFPDRFLTGTDFVSSMGEPKDFPGIMKFKEVPSGCIKDEANYRRQVTDTSAVNIFFNDEAFKKIVLGENFFKITGLDKQFGAPNVCPGEGKLERM